MKILRKFGKILLTGTMVINSGIIVPIFAQSSTETPNLSFFALSDTHVEVEGSDTKTYEGLEDALSDIIEINPDNSALVIPGDLTNNGLEREYEAVYGLIDKYSQVGQPMLAMGNHDVRWLCSSGDRNPASPTVPTCKPGTSPFDSRYLKFNQKYMGDVPEGQLYFDQWIGGYHFITLNTEKDLKDQAYLSEEQLQWLDDTLAENADVNKPIFVSIHQSFSDSTYQPGNSDAHIGEQEYDLKDVLKKYPQVVVMTGHTHPSMESTDVYNKYYGHIVEIPGLYYNGGTGDTKGRIGYQVNVFDDHIQFRLRDFEKDVWLDEYEKNFKLSDMDRDTSDDSFDLSLEGMEATAGSQNSNSGVEGPASNVLDGLTNTICHTKYGGTAITDNWINIHLDNKQVVNGLRYLPRQDGGTNGTFLEYEVYVSDDNGQTYSKVDSGSWKGNFKWQIAEFDAKEVTDVKLQPTKTTTTPTREYGSAAEIRLVYFQDGQVNKNKLKELIDQCEAIDKDDYLNRNWQKFEKALTSAKEAYDNSNVTQGEINDLYNRLSTAFNDLEKKPTLDNPIIKPLDAKAGSSYGSNQNPINVINGVGLSGDGTLQDKHDNEKSAKTMWHTAANPGNNAWFEVDLGEIYALDEMWIWNINQVNNVERGFKNVKIEYSLDEKNWKELKPEDGMEFLSESTEEYPFQFSMASGESLVDATNLNDKDHSPVKFNEIEAQYIKITAAPTAGIGSWGQNYFGLSELRFTQYFDVDKADLQTLYDECLTLKESEYTSESWSSFKTAMDEAKAIIDKQDVTQEEVDNAVKTLQAAKDALVKVVDSDKTALKIAIDLANVITEDDLKNIIPVVVEEFKTARDKANEVYNNASATQDEVNVAFDRLAIAMQKLEFFKGDKTALKAFIDKVSDLDSSKYTESTWAAFETELNEAIAVYEDLNAMQPEVNSAYEELVKEFLNLRLIPDKSLLEDLINQAEGLDSANYIKASFDGLTKALNEAKVVFENPNATQVEVDNAKATLEKAIAGLQANPSTPSNVDNTVSTPVNNGDTTSVKTGDESLVGMFATITLLSVTGYAVLRRKEN